MRGVAFGPSAASPDPNYDPSVMTAEAMMTLCAAKPSLCSHFVEGGGDWAAHSVPTSTRFTTYVSNRTCAPAMAACGGGEFLRCAARDMMVLIVMESYDVKASILAQICSDVGCDLFVSKNDGSGGTLFKLEAANASSYLRMAPAPPPPPTPGSLLWRFQTEGGVFTRPLVDDTTVVRCATSGKTCTCTGTAYYGYDFASFDAMLAQPHASQTSRNTIECVNDVFGDPILGSAKQCFCVSKGGMSVIYFGSQDGLLYALNTDGSLRWKSALGNADGGPAVDAVGNVYAGSLRKGIYGYHRDGHLFLNYTTGGGLRSTPAIDPQGTVYACSEDGFLYALNHDHTLAWRFQTGAACRNSPKVG